MFSVTVIVMRTGALFTDEIFFELFVTSERSILQDGKYCLLRENSV